MDFDPDCSGSEGAFNDKSFTAETDILILFDDPCQQIEPPIPTEAATLAFGGSIYNTSQTHEFNDMTWLTAHAGLVIINDGLEVFIDIVGRDNSLFIAHLVVTHELGHVLGFNHSDNAETPDLMANMSAIFCNPLNETDAACAQFAYPDDEGSVDTAVLETFVAARP